MRARLLGANLVYVERKPCPRCGFRSEAAQKDRALAFVIWDRLFAEDEGVPPEKRLEVWKRREAQREGLTRLLEWDERYLPEVSGAGDDG